MTVLRDVPGPEDVRLDDEPSPFSTVLDEKAWQLLGLTGEEFKRRWYDGEFRSDTRPAAAALDAFMRTGHWSSPALR